MGDGSNDFLWRFVNREGIKDTVFAYWKFSNKSSLMGMRVEIANRWSIKEVETLPKLNILALISQR